MKLSIVLYLPKPCSRVWIVPVSSLLGRLPCRWYQLVIMAPFSTACKAGWICAIMGVNVTTWSR